MKTSFMHQFVKISSYTIVRIKRNLEKISRLDVAFMRTLYMQVI